MKARVKKEYEDSYPNEYQYWNECFPIDLFNVKQEDGQFFEIRNLYTGSMEISRKHFEIVE